MIYFGFSLAVILSVLDRYLKWYAAHSLPPEGVFWIPGLLEIERYQNRGLAFGLAAPQTLILLVSTLAVVILVRHILRERRDRRAYLALTFLLLGAGSNFYDRLTLGAVVDYLRVGPLSLVNIADGMIVGGLLLAWRSRPSSPPLADPARDSTSSRRSNLDKVRDIFHLPSSILLRAFWITAAVVAALDLGFLLYATWPKPTAPRLEQLPQLAAPAAMSPSLSGEAITIGAILPLSGENSWIGAGIKNALELAAEEINAEQGFAGRPARLLIKDGGCESGRAASAMRELVDKEKVLAVIGGVCSAETLGLAPLASRARVTSLAPAGSAPEISSAGEYVFRLVPSDKLTKAAAADYQKERPGEWRLRPYFNERAPAAENFFRKYQERFGVDGRPSWYLANAYSAVFLFRDLYQKHGGQTANWLQELSRLKNWSGGALTDLSFDQNGDPLWTRFVVSEIKNGTPIDREIYDTKKAP